MLDAFKVLAKGVGPNLVVEVVIIASECTRSLNVEFLEENSANMLVTKDDP